jgi:penicillin-binding protein-related factor A (putative recombinase)
MGRSVQPEKEIETSILEFLESKKVFSWKNQSVAVFDPSKGLFRKSRNRFAINGTSDILGVYQGKILAIEVKTPHTHKSLAKNFAQLSKYLGDDKTKNRLKEQIKFIGNINHQGGIGFFASSISDVKRELGL